MLPQPESEATANYSLSQLLDKAEEIYRELDEGTLSSTDSKYQKQVEKTLKELLNIQKAVDILSLFSENEAIAEINTNYLKFLLVNFYLGRFTLMLNQQDQRLELLEKSKTYFLSFLSLCKSYGLVSKEVSKASEALSSGRIVLTREEKIARFRREKESKIKLEALLSRESAKDDEYIRDLYFSKIEYCQQKVIEELESIEQESKVLKLMPPPTKNEDTVVEDLAWRLDTLPPLTGGKAGLLDSKGKPLRPFIITGRQKELQDQVFRPSWRLPTMSIEEYLQIEMDRGNFLQGGGERPEKQNDEFDEEPELQEAALLKQREWDDFKDNNPRGSGNRGNKG